MGSQSQPINARISTPLLVSVFPPEVLDYITSYLTTPEYGNFRLTCKQVEAALLESFSQEFFSKRQFMLTEFSLKTLVDVSKSRFSTNFKHVIFSLERPYLPSLQLADRNGPVPDVTTAQKHNRQLQEYVDHAALINTCQDVEMLAESFRNLENLDTIGIRDFYSRSRNRDHPFTEWRSYGVGTFEQGTGIRLNIPRPGYMAGGSPIDPANYLSRLFINVFRALGQGSTRPKNFEVILRHNSLHDNAFHMPKYVVASTQPVLASLRKLFLDLNAELPCLYVDSSHSITPCPNYFLRKFLSKLRQLEHLRLNFRVLDSHGAHEILSWLSKTASANTLNTPHLLSPSPPHIHLDHLRQLDIGMAVLKPRVLLDILEKYHATLRSISLHRVTLLHGDSPAANRINLWAKLFGQMSKLNLELTAINLSVLSQEQPDRQHIRQVTFNDSRDPASRAWGGTDVQSALRDFTNHLVVGELNEDTDDNSDSGSEGSGGSDDSMHDVESDAE